ncbi:MAG: M18 family aminopeptidase [Bacteroidaceae bacterium]|nr:M18 family aminopeptidase [Bacteroidaceae bacterium]
MNTHPIPQLMAMLDASPVNFLAAAYVEEQLTEAGFTRLDAGKPFPMLIPGKGYFITKNDSAVFAFRMGTSHPAEAGFKLICAHSDSPCFRVKPAPEMYTEGGVVKLNTEVYGGPILYTWFDRPLSLAGRVLLRGTNPLKPQVRRIKIERPLLIIPHIAIHFNRQVNDGNPLSKQVDMLPVISIINSKLEADNLLLTTIANELGVSMTDILDFDLSLYDTQKSQLVGLNEEFISSGRLDDLAMVHAGLYALLHSNATPMTQVLAIFDNEETGSGTKQGAASPVLRNLLERVVTNDGCSADGLYRALEHSFMISADMAHALHPNHPGKHDPTNHPVMGGGPVIKINANQKYVTDAESASVFAEICRIAGVPFQYFVNHSDMAGGSTLGNILTSQLPMRGVDMGNPMWGMHSVRETAAAVDHEYACRAFTTFFELK